MLLVVVVMVVRVERERESKVFLNSLSMRKRGRVTRQRGNRDHHHSSLRKRNNTVKTTATHLVRTTTSTHTHTREHPPGRFMCFFISIFSEFLMNVCGWRYLRERERVSLIPSPPLRQHHHHHNQIVTMMMVIVKRKERRSNGSQLSHFHFDFFSFADSTHSLLLSFSYLQSRRSLPVVRRASSSACAFPASASGITAPIVMASFPSATQPNTSAHRAASSSGVRR